MLRSLKTSSFRVLQFRESAVEWSGQHRSEIVLVFHIRNYNIDQWIMSLKTNRMFVSFFFCGHIFGKKTNLVGYFAKPNIWPMNLEFFLVFPTKLVKITIYFCLFYKVMNNACCNSLQSYSHLYRHNFQLYSSLLSGIYRFVSYFCL